MSIQSKTTLKNYFKTGDKPTQAQFADLIDSCFNVQQYEDLSLWPTKASSKSTTLSKLTLNITSMYVVTATMTMNSVAYGFNIVCHCNMDNYYTLHLLTNGTTNNQPTFYTYCVNLNTSSNTITVQYVSDCCFYPYNNGVMYKYKSPSNNTKFLRITQLS